MFICKQCLYVNQKSYSRARKCSVTQDLEEVVFVVRSHKIWQQETKVDFSFLNLLPLCTPQDCVLLAVASLLQFLWDSMARATIACQTSVLITCAKVTYELTLRRNENLFNGTMGQWPMVNAIDSYLESLHCVPTLRVSILNQLCKLPNFVQIFIWRSILLNMFDSLAIKPTSFFRLLNTQIFFSNC